ncbi:hypothetical protein [Candidatus Methylocalor cossyra]|uniref:Uncharacterized protein n=1 Tax=Candidatus Methylocalor cossyra TaxID=3108543 RepID=A0ABM9NIS6_9GAMM
MRPPSIRSLALCCTLFARDVPALEPGLRDLSPPAVLADLVLLRPFGLAMTAAGAGLLIATAPFTALASVAAPHDAFLRAGTALVAAPGAFTFLRPLGDFRYQMTGSYFPPAR